jgi:predicted metal-dependent peptidase
MSIIQDVAKVSKTLMFREPFYGLFLISLNKTESKQIPTAAVGKHNINTQLLVNPDFWKFLDDDVNTKIAILKHELLHIAFFHLTTHHEYDDKELHNIAADLEINQYIENELKGPKWMGLELSHYPELSLKPKMGTRYYYDELSKVNKKRQSGNPSGPSNPSQGGSHGSDLTADDLKDMFDKWKNGESESGNDGSSPEKSKIWDVYDANKQGEATVCSHDSWKEFVDGLSEADRKLIEKQINYQLKEVANEVKQRNRGLIPSEMQSKIDSLFEVKPPVTDWKAYVRRFGGSSNKIVTKKTRRKQSKRYEDNPALRIKNKKHLLVGIDTSGSVSNDELMEFFNEIHHIYKTGVQVSIAECDATVHAVYEYKGKVPEYVHGRGGTAMTPIIEYFNDNVKKYNNLIILTDGECEHTFPKVKGQLLWVICSGGTSLESIKNFPGAKIKIHHDN